MKNKIVKLTEKQLKEMIENQLNKNLSSNNLDEIISIDSETAEREPDLVKKISDKIGDKEVIKISESYIRKLIENNIKKPRLSKKKLLESLKLKTNDRRRK